jgi:ParB/RepB/Spo0J family partition protein
MATPVSSEVAVAPATLNTSTEYLTVALARLRESKTNPRRTFEANALQELAESIRSHGVLMPLLVRPAGETFEIVAGARRYRAARLAKVAELPVRVRHLSDKEVLEVQVIENLQRADIHPLEEADGYRQLHEKHGYSIDELATKVGKSKAYLYARMKLCSLVEQARKPFLSGAISPSVALLLARIPVPALQAKAAKEVTDRHGGAMSFREAADHIQREYMLRLSEAGFPTTDPDLVPAAGPCSTCPKRTGNQRELFDDIKSADVCTDPVCFRSKREAAFARAATEAQANGGKVLSDSTTKKMFQSYGGLSYDAQREYATLDEHCSQDPKGRNLETALGKHAATAVVLAKDPQSGAMLKLIPRKTLPKLLKDAGVTRTERQSAARATGAGGDSYAREQRKREKKARLESAFRRHVLDAIREKVPAHLGVAELRIVATGFVIDLWAENRKVVCRILGWEIADRKDAETVLKEHIEILGADALAELLMVLALVRETYAGTYDTSSPRRLLAAAKHYKVNPARIRKDLEAAARAKEAKKAPAKAARKK